MSAPIRRMILNPANVREAHAAAERLVRSLDLRATVDVSETADGWLRTVVWTHSEADSVALANLVAARHTRARFDVVHSGTDDHLIIHWKKLETA